MGDKSRWCIYFCGFILIIMNRILKKLYGQNSDMSTKVIWVKIKYMWIKKQCHVSYIKVMFFILIVLFLKKFILDHFSSTEINRRCSDVKFETQFKFSIFWTLKCWVTWRAVSMGMKPHSPLVDLICWVSLTKLESMQDGKDNY